MTSIMRRTVRGTAAGLGALVIVAGTAACGGLLDGDDGDDGATVEEQQPADGGAEDDTEGDTSDTDSDDSGAAEEDTDSADTEDAQDADDAGDREEGDGDDSASGGSLSEDDLSAVADRYYEFLTAAVEGDGEAGCGLLMNPYTDAPLEGSALEACAEGFSSKAEEQGMDASLLDVIDPSMIEGVDNGDGTAGVSMLGQDGGVTFVKGDDGTWYIDGENLV